MLKEGFYSKVKIFIDEKTKLWKLIVIDNFWHACTKYKSEYIHFCLISFEEKKVIEEKRKSR